MEEAEYRVTVEELADLAEKWGNYPVLDSSEAQTANAIDRLAIAVLKIGAAYLERIEDLAQNPRKPVR